MAVDLGTGAMVGGMLGLVEVIKVLAKKIPGYRGSRNNGDMPRECVKRFAEVEKHQFTPTDRENLDNVRMDVAGIRAILEERKS